MATRATDALTWLSRQWERVEDRAHLRDDTATQSGILPDETHKKRGGYHVSRQDQPKNNYSVVRVDDRPGCGPSDAAAAIDMTYARTADLAACHERLRVMWRNRTTHPAAKFINAWCGWDGSGGPGRYDVVTGAVSSATDDHKWHIHLEVRRRYVENMDAMRAVLAVLSPEGAKSVDTMWLEKDPYGSVSGSGTMVEYLRHVTAALLGGSLPPGTSENGVVPTLTRVEAAIPAILAAAQAPHPAVLTEEDRRSIALMVSQEIGGKLDRLLAAMAKAGEAVAEVDDQPTA